MTLAEEGSGVRADSIGCMETSQSEPSKAADAVIKAVLKGAFHRWREDTVVALSKEQSFFPIILKFFFIKQVVICIPTILC